MDRRSSYFPPVVPCVRCGAFFPPVHPQSPCPHCGLPARFSLPWQGEVPMFSAPIAPIEPAAPIADLDRATSSGASSSRIPVLPGVEREAPFSGDELQALLRLRERYEQGDASVRDDEFTEEERARLAFVRWLYRSGRLEA